MNPRIALLVLASFAASITPAVAQSTDAPASGTPVTIVPVEPPSPIATRLVPTLPPAVAWPADHPLAKTLALIEAADLKDDVEWLSDDERKGRCAGEPSCDEAAEWIADRFEDMGLEPLGEGGKFLQPFEFVVRGGEGQQGRTNNVVGFWPGSDPKLREEVVVLGAHYDHVGTGTSLDAGRIGDARPEDAIWNGADDNASGTSILIEVAHAFAASGMQPRRSLVFVAFSGEEQGLFGSLWYCQHPLVPLEKTVAMINMDMVGRNPDKPVETAALGSLENDRWIDLFAASRGAAPSLEFKLILASRPDSDHASFIDHRVPAAFLFTGMHDEYHTIHDHASKLAYDHMEQLARFATALAWNAANCEQRLAFTPPNPTNRPSKRLGMSGDGSIEPERLVALALPKDQGAFVVRELDPAGVGAKAGLQDGDVILAIDGKKLNPDDPATSVRRLIGGAARGKDVPIVVRRGAEELTLTARWE